MFFAELAAGMISGPIALLSDSLDNNPGCRSLEKKRIVMELSHFVAHPTHMQTQYIAGND